MNNHFGSPKKTVTRTFRIRQEWDWVLLDEAAREGVSVNVLLNKILRKYALYSRWADRNNDLSLPQQSLRNILSKVQIERLVEAGTDSGAFDFMNNVNSMGLEMDYDSFVYLTTEHLGGSDFARWFQCFHHTKGNKDIFHLQHNLGYGWSAYLSNYLTSGLRSLADVDAETRIHDYVVYLEVTLPRIEFVEKPRKIDLIIA